MGALGLCISCGLGWRVCGVIVLVLESWWTSFLLAIAMFVDILWMLGGGRYLSRTCLTEVNHRLAT